MMHSSNELEKILYSIIIELSKVNAPIIFKGALALKELLFLNNPNLDIDRKTVDIDANWIEKYDKDKIFRVIESAIKKVNNDYTVELVREPSENRSMGFKILDNNNSIVSKIDMDIKNNPFYVIYNIDGINIKYSSINKMMADKLMSISGNYIFRRVKDLLDIYIIISNCKVNIDDIKKVLVFENKKIGDFSTMISNKDSLRDAYNKLLGINNKPLFDVVWDTIITYLEREKFI